jgi:ubiquinone/menaquinone biosynthesis C-methylase UbiE
MMFAGSDHVAERFSAAAPSYKRLADIQAGLARSLVVSAGDVKDLRVLDAGAGTGGVAEALALAGAEVVALDLARGMVDEGRRGSPQVRWLQADLLGLPLRSSSMDRVLSASAYQWVPDLKRAFAEAHRVLKPGGRLSVVLFGQGTLAEFFARLETAAVSTGRVLPPFRRLPSTALVHGALDAAGFRRLSVTSERRVRDFCDVRALLVWLKAIGANGMARDFFWGRKFLAEVEAVPGPFTVTFEVIWAGAEA